MDISDTTIQVLSTGLDPNEICTNLASFGEITGIYRDEEHPDYLIVQFSDKQALDRVFESVTLGLLVSRLPSRPCVLDQHSASSGSRSETVQNGEYPVRSFPGHLAAESVILSSVDLLNDKRTQKSSTLTNGGSFFQALRSCRSKLARKECNADPTRGFHPRIGIEAVDPAPTSPDSENSASAPLITVCAYPTLSTVLSLSFYGETITFDLKTLEKDPLAIIELLKWTGGDCAHWMTVGAYYRRSGNAKAAVSVIQAMIKCRIVMVEQGIPEDQFKPAYLLLSSCEADLARQRTTERSAAKAHLIASQTWLRKVYGKLNSSDPDVQSSTHRSVAYLKCEDATSSRHRETSPILTSRGKCFQHELAWTKEQSTMITSLKRKYEDEIAFERDGRRRLLRQLADLEKELTKARKMERCALSQVAREVAARRKAEDSLREERAMRHRTLKQDNTMDEPKPLKSKANQQA